MNPRGRRRGHAKLDILRAQTTGHAPTVAARQRHRGQAQFARGDQGGQDVGRVAAGRNRQQHVAGTTQGADLPGEDLLEGVVVGDGGQRRTVGGQRDGGQSRPFDLEAVDQFGGEMLGVGGGAAVAASQNLVASPQPLGQMFGGLNDKRSQGGEGTLLGRDAGGEMLLDAREWFHHPYPVKYDEWESLAHSRSLRFLDGG